MDSPRAVLDEVIVILDLISPDFDTAPVTSAFNMTVSLYQGRYPGYRSCNTEYHDLHHTIETFLATARLIHGAVLDGKIFTDRRITLGLITAFLHDAGYIQEESDKDGTGAKYTANHVQRSIDFLECHGSELGLSHDETTEGRAIILCTDLAVDISTIVFKSAEVELLGKILGSADLLAQMADRTYLEKLLFLYHEFKEAGIRNYLDEVDLLRKTLAFYDFVSQRLKTTLDETDLFMGPHFTSRWGIHEDLYHVAIAKQRDFLKKILEIKDSDPRDHLKRSVVNKIRREY
ncbi:MAG TPA: hypothetical protein VMW78_07055 [Anaerolineae bacterium]|nr:hypothetical protein [Anaerolineae bacterium]